MFFPLEDVDADVRKVLDTAALLEITEFELFGLAYRRWFGRPAAAPIVERHFVRYMFDDRVPFWVRRFTLDVQELQRRGTLDRETVVGARATPRQAEVGRGLRYAVILCAVIILLVVLVESSRNLLPYAHDCYFPPCY